MKDVTLPSAKQLIDTFRGLSDGVPGLSAQVAELSRCHRELLRVGNHFCDTDIRRCELMDDIDRWARQRLGRRTAVPLHTESLGTVIDRLAARWAVAVALLTDEAPADVADRRQLAFERLSELANAYDDLVADLVGGRRRLPVS